MELVKLGVVRARETYGSCMEGNRSRATELSAALGLQVRLTWWLQGASEYVCIKPAFDPMTRILCRNPAKDSPLWNWLLSLFASNESCLLVQPHLDGQILPHSREEDGIGSLGPGDW